MENIDFDAIIDEQNEEQNIVNSEEEINNDNENIKVYDITVLGKEILRLHEKIKFNFASDQSKYPYLDGIKAQIFNVGFPKALDTILDTLKIFEENNINVTKGYFIQHEDDINFSIGILNQIVDGFSTIENENTDETIGTFSQHMLALMKMFDDGIANFRKELKNVTDNSITQEKPSFSKEDINNELKKVIKNSPVSSPINGKEAKILIANDDFSWAKVATFKNLTKDAINEEIMKCPIQNVKLYMLNEIPTVKKQITVTMVE